MNKTFKVNKHRTFELQNIRRNTRNQNFTCQTDNTSLKEQHKLMSLNLEK